VYFIYKDVGGGVFSTVNILPITSAQLHLVPISPRQLLVFIKGKTLEPAMPEVYPPLEDSLLLAAEVRKHAVGRVLDMGCGSGIQSLNALKRKSVKSVLGVDVNKKAIAHCKKNIKGRKVKFIHSDLFKKVPASKFDTIIFNPPYLPKDEYPDDPATIGGTEGWETIERFLQQAPEYLTLNGQILLLFTSLTDKKKVHELLDTALFDWKALATNHISFETYYVYKLTKNDIRKDAEKNHVKNLTYFSRGRRGIIYTGIRRGVKVALKANNPQTKAIGRLDNEARMLKLVNKKGIGPTLLFSTKKLSLLHVR